MRSLHLRGQVRGLKMAILAKDLRAWLDSLPANSSIAITGGQLLTWVDGTGIVCFDLKDTDAEGLCAACRVAFHDTCSGNTACRCCRDTLRNG